MRTAIVTAGFLRRRPPKGWIQRCGLRLVAVRRESRDSDVAMAPTRRASLGPPAGIAHHIRLVSWRSARLSRFVKVKDGW